AGGKRAGEQCGYLPADGVDTLGQRHERRHSAVVSAAAVVRHDDGVRAILHSRLSILAIENTLDDDGELGGAAEPIDVLPGRVRRGWAQDTRLIFAELVPYVAIPVGRVLMIHADTEPLGAGLGVLTRPVLRF